MKWIVLCVSNNRASLQLYRSILELDGHWALGAANADEALMVSEGIAIDCVVVDCEDKGISVTRKIARARPRIPILFVSDQPDVEMQVYSETDMFLTKEEAIEEPSRWIGEVMGHSVCRCDDDGRTLSRTSRTEARALHAALVRWLLPW